MSSQERYLSMTSFHPIHFPVSSALQSFYPPFFLSSPSISLASFWIIIVCCCSDCSPAVSHGNSLRLVSFYLFYLPYPVICLAHNSCGLLQRQLGTFCLPLQYDFAFLIPPPLLFFLRACKIFLCMWRISLILQFQLADWEKSSLYNFSIFQLRQSIIEKEGW